MQKYDKKQVQKNFSQAAGRYDENARLQKRVVMELLSRVGELEGTVLDVGAGTGMIAENASFKPVEMDLAFDMCKQSKGLSVNGDAENLPFADESFEHVVSSLAIQWLSDLDGFAAEMKRVLKSKGTFALTTFGNGTLLELEKSFQKLDGGQHLIRFPNTIFLFAVLKKAGFEGLDIHAQTITYRHDNAMEILKQMKNIGATYALSEGNKGLRGKNYFKDLDKAYRKDFSTTDNKLLATWQVLYITGYKA